MRYSFVSAALVALISSVAAQTAGFDAISVPTQDQQVPAGSTLEITWDPNGVTGTVTLSLLQGATASTLALGPVLAAGIDNTLGKYAYTVPSTSAFATYGIKIELDSTAKSASPTFQYSFPFHLTGGSSVSGSSTVTSTTGTSVSTTTVHLSTGPSYTSSSAVVTSTSTSVVPSSTTTVIKTSSNTTSTTAPISTSGSGSNVTLSTTLKSGTNTAAGTTSGSASTSSAAPVTSHNAAATKMATGGMALVGGLLVALAL